MYVAQHVVMSQCAYLMTIVRSSIIDEVEKIVMGCYIHFRAYQATRTNPRIDGGFLYQ